MAFRLMAHATRESQVSRSRETCRTQRMNCARLLIVWTHLEAGGGTLGWCWARMMQHMQAALPESRTPGWSIGPTVTSAQTQSLVSFLATGGLVAAA